MANSVVYTDGGRVGFVLKGAYDSSATYEHLDVVNYNGMAFMCRLDNTTGIAPTAGTITANWQPVVDQPGHDIYSRITQNVFYHVDQNIVLFENAMVSGVAVAGKSANRIVPFVNISSAEWTAIQAIFNPTTT